MRISAEEKRNLLLQRGFTPQEIDSGFREYLVKRGKEWKIYTITPEEVRETYELDDIRKLFRKDSIRQDWSVPSSHDDFGYYSSIHENIKDEQVNAPVLDPFVARLVLAANQCCIFTTMSCDGWHRKYDGKKRKLTLWMQDTYSTVWFWIIAEFVFSEQWPKQNPWPGRNWFGIFEPNNEADEYTDQPSKVIYRIMRDGEADAYKKINHYAVFLERYSAELCEIREKWITLLKSSLDDDWINRVNFCRLRTTIKNPVLSDLWKLAHEWNKMKKELEEKTRTGIQAWDFVRYK